MRLLSVIGSVLAASSLISATPLPLLQTRKYSEEAAKYDLQRVDNIEAKYNHLRAYVKEAYNDEEYEDFDAIADMQMFQEIQIYMEEAKERKTTPTNFDDDPALLYEHEEVQAIVAKYEMGKLRRMRTNPSQFESQWQTIHDNWFNIEMKTFIKERIHSGLDTAYWKNQLKVFEKTAKDRAKYLSSGQLTNMWQEFEDLDLNAHPDTPFSDAELPPLDTPIEQDKKVLEDIQKQLGEDVKVSEVNVGEIFEELGR